MKTLRRFYITSSLSMKRFLLILIFIHIFITIASCSQTVGTNPQDVEDIFLHGGDRVKVDVWVENLKIPWALVFLKDGRALVSERPEQIRLIKNGRLQEMPYMEIEVAHVGEGGLLGLALHPEFPKKPYIYAYHTYKKGDVLYNRVIQLKDNEINGTFNRIIIDNIPGGRLHNGGRMSFVHDGLFFF